VRVRTSGCHADKRARAQDEMHDHQHTLLFPFEVGRFFFRGNRHRLGRDQDRFHGRRSVNGNVRSFLASSLYTTRPSHTTPPPPRPAPPPPYIHARAWVAFFGPRAGAQNKTTASKGTQGVRQGYPAAVWRRPCGCGWWRVLPRAAPPLPPPANSLPVATEATLMGLVASGGHLVAPLGVLIGQFGGFQEAP
jgi:hypothetical protein